jgi:hypothetical protein
LIDDWQLNILIKGFPIRGRVEVITTWLGMGKWIDDSRFPVTLVLPLSRPSDAVIALAASQLDGRGQPSLADTAEPMGATVVARVAPAKPRPAAVALAVPNGVIVWRRLSPMLTDQFGKMPTRVSATGHLYHPLGRALGRTKVNITNMSA